MTDFDFPADLLDLQRAWYAADARCVEAGAALPSGRDVAAGVAEPTDRDAYSSRTGYGLGSTSPEVLGLTATSCGKITAVARSVVGRVDNFRRGARSAGNGYFHC